MSDCYAGLDCKVEVPFTVIAEKDVKRDVFVHPEDQELDNATTLFEQFMGLGKEDSDDEGDESPAERKAKRRVKQDKTKEQETTEGSASASDSDSDSSDSEDED